MSVRIRRPKQRRSWVEEVVQAMIWGGLIIGCILGVLVTAAIVLVVWWVS
jgi:hypothetical protein